MAAVKGKARLLALAGQAKPSPQIGQALGPLGVNMMEFCKQFNAKTESFKETALMRVRLTVCDCIGLRGESMLSYAYIVGSLDAGEAI